MKARARKPVCFMHLPRSGAAGSAGGRVSRTAGSALKRSAIHQKVLKYRGRANFAQPKF